MSKSGGYAGCGAYAGCGTCAGCGACREAAYRRSIFGLRGACCALAECLRHGGVCPRLLDLFGACGGSENSSTPLLEYLKARTVIPADFQGWLGEVIILRFALLSMDKLNPMPKLESLTLAYTRLEDELLNELDKCFPNLQVLKLVCVSGLEDPKIQHRNLQTCHWVVSNNRLDSLTLITPNLIKLTIDWLSPAAIHVEAPVLSHFHLCVNLKHVGAFTAKKFENLKTLWLDSNYTGSLLSAFPTAKTIETLTLESGNLTPRDISDSKLTLGKVFMVFPNVSSLCIYSNAWSEIEACLNPEGWEILDGRKGLKTICAYLELLDPSLTFSSISRVLDQCIGLSEVSLLIHRDFVDAESKSFMSKCMARWPGLKWRWGIWGLFMEETWIADGLSNQTLQSIQ